MARLGVAISQSHLPKSEISWVAIAQAAVAQSPMAEGGAGEAKALLPSVFILPNSEFILAVPYRFPRTIQLHV